MLTGASETIWERKSKPTDEYIEGQICPPFFKKWLNGYRTVWFNIKIILDWTSKWISAADFQSNHMPLKHEGRKGNVGGLVIS